jgi:hypothetical protein
MAEPIMATYVQSDEDWTITVSGPGEPRSAKAPGIIAARDRADQMVEELAPDGKPTVVHLLNGSALDFTEAYMTARLTLPETAPLEVPPPGAGKQAEASNTEDTAEPASARADEARTDVKAEAEHAEPESAKPETAEEKPPLPQSKQLPKAIEPRKPSEVGGKPVVAKQAADVVKPPAAAR